MVIAGHPFTAAAALLLAASLVTETRALSPERSALISRAIMRRKDRRTVERPAKSWPVGPRSGLARVTAPGGGSISGSVRDTDGVAAASDFVLTVLDTFGFRVHESYQYGADGAYQATGLYPGSYLVGARSDYGLPVYYHGETTDPFAASWVAVNDNAVTGIDLRLLPGSQTPPFVTITVSGTCYRGPGTAEPLAGGSIEVLGAQRDSLWNTFVERGTIESDGAFSVTLTGPVADYYVAVRATETKLDPSTYTATSTVFQPQWWDGSPIGEEPVTVRLESDIEGAEMHFTEGGTIDGVVTPPAGSGPVSSVNVAAVNTDGIIYASDYLFADSTFTLAGLPPDTYFVKMQWSSDYRRDYYSGAISSRDATPLVVSAGQTVGGIEVPLTLRGSASSGTGLVSGRLTIEGTGQPAADADIAAIMYEDGWQSHHYAWVESTGAFEIEVPGGVPFHLRAESGGQQRDYYLCPTYYPDALGPQGADTLRVQAGDTLTADIALKLGGSIAGFLRDSADAPLAGDLDMLFDAEDGVALMGYALDRQGRADPVYVDGTVLGGFRATGLPAGAYDMGFCSFAVGTDLPPRGPSATTVSTLAVDREQTTVIGPLVPTESGGKITGTLSGSADQVLYEVVCYDTAGNLKALSLPAGVFNSTYGGTRDVRSYVFDYDWDLYEEMLGAEPGPVEADQYAAVYLPPGRYAVAALGATSMGDPSTYQLQWYGGPTTKWSNSYTEVFAADIPDGVTWITVAPDQTVTGIDFTSGQSVARPAPQPASPLLRVTASGGTARIGYRLPANGEAGGSIKVYSPAGRRIADIPLDKPSGIVRWDASRNGAAPGAYVFSLRAGGLRLARRLVLF